MPAEGHDHEVVAPAGGDHAHQLVTLAQVDGDEALPARLVVLAEGRLLHLAVGGGEDQELVLGKSLVVTIAWIDSWAAGQRFTTAVPLAVRSFIGISCPAGGRPCPGSRTAGGRRASSCARSVDEVLVAQLRALHAAPTAALGAERVGGDRLDVAGLGHRDDDLLVVDQVLHPSSPGSFTMTVRGRWRTCRGSRHLVGDDAAQLGRRRRGSTRARRWSRAASPSPLRARLRPRRVRRPRVMSRMWLACSSENSKGAAISALRAAGRSSEPRIVAMTGRACRWPCRSPSTMWARASALRRRNSVRRVTTSTWCAM
jgi:hypothetical protein